MSVNTNNIYGEISISDQAIAKFVSHVAMECYGMVEFVSCGFFATIAEVFCKDSVTRGVKISTLGDRIFIDVYVVVKYGVSINAVAEALKESIKYKTEKFTGMLVDTVNVNILGVKL